MKRLCLQKITTTTTKKEDAMNLVIKEACKADLCGFLRCGFKQVTDREGTKWALDAL